jgi:hypothetical protein
VGRFSRGRDENFYSPFFSGGGVFKDFVWIPVG